MLNERCVENVTNWAHKRDQKPGKGMQREVAMSLGMARGVHAVHSSFGVHGSIKGTNVLVRADNTVCVSDFAFSEIKRYALSNARGDGLINYQAPEVFLDYTLKPTVQADVYSLGCVMWELAQGERPWKDLRDMKVHKDPCGALLISNLCC